MREGNLACQEVFWEEMIDGQIVAMSPRPAWRHISTAGNIYRIFADFLRGKRCIPIPDGMDLHLSEKDHFIPDMMVVCDRDSIKNDGVYGAPSLVVEVLSPSTAKRDIGYKKNAYEAAGVGEYWIVNTDSKSVEVYLLQDGRYVLDEVYSVYPDYLLKKMSDEERAAVPTEFHCSLFDDLTIRLEEVFERVL